MKCIFSTFHYNNTERETDQPVVSSEYAFGPLIIVRRAVSSSGTFQYIWSKLRHELDIGLYNSFSAEIFFDASRVTLTGVCINADRGQVLFILLEIGLLICPLLFFESDISYMFAVLTAI